MSEPATEAETEPAAPEHTSRLARIIAAFGAGDSAALRRNRPAILCVHPVFHRLLTQAGLDVADMGLDAARDWAVIAHAIALTVRHGATLPAGEAMAAAGLSEARFAKLMAARGATLRDQVAILARYLAAKQSPINWQDLTQLLRAERMGDSAGLDRARYRIARAFYVALYKADQKYAG